MQPFLLLCSLHAICFFFLILSKPQLILGNSKSTFNWPNTTNFYYMIQISPSLPPPKRDFSADSSMVDSGYDQASLKEGYTGEVCQKRLER